MQLRIRLALSCLLFVSSARAQTIFVDVEAGGANSGSSWNDAFTDLQSALAVAQSGDQIWVAQGVYTPGPSAAASDSFFMKDGVKLYGGFAGGETSLAQRDWVAHIALLSGDVGHDDATATPWWSAAINTPNSAHVVTALGVDAAAKLDGFRIEAGNIGPWGLPAGASEMFGSGVYSIDSDLTIEHCTFHHNISSFASGAALYASSSNLSIRSCTFDENLAYFGNGGAVFVTGAGAPTIEDCAFVANSAKSGNGGLDGQGGAIALDWNAPTVTIARCTFDANVAGQAFTSGAHQQARGGGLSSFADNVFVRDCEFRNSVANAGGGLYLWGSATVVNCLFQENNVYNVVIQGVTLSGTGSAISAATGNGELVRVEDCTLVRNHVVGGEGAAVYGFGPVSVQVRNSILWGNTAPITPLRFANYKGAVRLSNSCVENLFTPDAGDPPPPPSQVPGCIDGDPLFLDLLGGDLHLTLASPCIDSGSNAFVPGYATTDLDGADRVALGVSALVVDMGAYEFPSHLPGPCATLIRAPQPVTAFVGQRATFSVLAMGAPLTYQWRRNGSPLSNGAVYSGVSSPELQIASVALSNAGSYDVLIGSSCGSASSGAAVLTVNPALLGEVFCSGDGAGLGCPCGNDKDAGEGCENSTGNGARLRGAGSSSVSLNDAVLTATFLPANKSAIVFMGDSKKNSGLGNWFGDGLLCLYSTHRFPLSNSGPSGVVTLNGPASLAPLEVQAGLTLHFQAWYRDPSGPCGKSFNTSNAYTVVFTP